MCLCVFIWFIILQQVHSNKIYFFYLRPFTFLIYLFICISVPLLIRIFTFFVVSFTPSFIAYYLITFSHVSLTSLSFSCFCLHLSRPLFHSLFLYPITGLSVWQTGEIRKEYTRSTDTPVNQKCINTETTNSFYEALYKIRPTRQNTRRHAHGTSFSDVPRVKYSATVQLSAR